MSIKFHHNAIIVSNETLTMEQAQEIAEKISWDKNISTIKFNTVSFSRGSIEEFSNRLSFNYRENKKVMFEFNNSTLRSEDIFILSKHFPYFTKIHFKKCDLNDMSIETITKYLEKNPKNITTVHLENNRFSPRAHHTLLNSLLNNTNVNKLFLANTHLTGTEHNYKSVYEHLSQLLEKNSTLEVLGIQENKMKLSELVEITAGLAKNTSLTCISVGEKAFKDDKTGEFTHKLTQAVKTQGIIHQFSEAYLFRRPPNPSMKFLEKAIAENNAQKLRFFDALTSANLPIIKQLLENNTVNMNWSRNNTHYNALHIISLSKAPSNKIGSVVKLLYQYGFRDLLYKRSGHSSGSIQAIDLAIKKGRQDIAGILKWTFGKSQAQKLGDIQQQQNYQYRGSFTCNITDNNEFPSLQPITATAK